MCSISYIEDKILTTNKRRYTQMIKRIRGMEQEGKDGKNKNSDSPFDSDASCKEGFPPGDLCKVVVAPSRD